MQEQTSHSTHNLSFWFHLLITILAWLGPFLFSWYVLVPVYCIVILQFIVFKRCLLNAKHDLDDGENTTFYSYLFEQVGLNVNKKALKKIVRGYLYIIMSAITLLWQLVFKIEPLLF